jgi:hypothetical protein
MSSPLFTDSMEFLNVVRLLRTWDPQFRHLALYAAAFWSDERIDDVQSAACKRMPHEFIN